MRLRLLLSLRVLAAVVAGLLAVSAFAADPLFTRDGLGLSGYDAVAYFTESKPVQGSPQFEYQWGGVRWRFASAAHRETFAASPEKYAPQYGGYCAYAVSRNQLAPTDPEVIQRGDTNWPGVLTK